MRIFVIVGALLLTATLAAAQPVVKSTVCGTQHNGADVTLPFSGVAANDVTVLIGGHGDSSDDTTYGPVTEGYTYLIDASWIYPDGGVWFKRQGATPDLSVVGEGGGHTRHAVAYCAVVLDGSTVHAEIMDTGSGYGGFAGVSPSCPSVITNTDNALMICIAMSGSVDTSIGTVDGFTSLNGGGTAANDNDDVTLGIASKVIPIGGTHEWPSRWSSWTPSAGIVFSFAVKAQ